MAIKGGPRLQVLTVGKDSAANASSNERSARYTDTASKLFVSFNRHFHSIPIFLPISTTFCRFFLCCCLKLAGTFGAELICRSSPNLTTTQLNICLEVPRAMVVLSDVLATFEDECSWQFKTSRWNCTGVRAPVYVNTDLEGIYV